MVVRFAESKSGFDVGLIAEQIRFAEKNLSNFVIIWLTEKSKQENHLHRLRNCETLQLLLGLQRKVQRVHKTSSFIECLRLLQHYRDSDVFLIATPNVLLSENSTSRLQSFVNVKYMFYYGSPFPWKKYVGNIEKRLARNSLTECDFNILPSDLNQCQNIENFDSDTQLWIFRQLLVELIVRHSTSEETLKDFLTYSRKENAKDSVRLEQIDDYERNHKKTTPIQIYIKKNFVTSLVQRNLRSHYFEGIFSIRHYLIELYTQIKNLHSSQLNNRADGQVLTLYRGVNIPVEEFESLQKCKGDYIATNSFVSTTTDKEVALFFTSTAENSSRNKTTPVLFCFEFDCLQNITKPMAHIKNLSEIVDENEFLFTMGTIFTLRDIVKENGIFQICLRRTARAQAFGKELFESFFRSPLDIDRLISMLTNLNDGELRGKIEYLKTPPINKNAQTPIDNQDRQLPSSTRAEPRTRWISWLRAFRNFEWGVYKIKITLSIIVILILLIVAIIVGVVLFVKRATNLPTVIVTPQFSMISTLSSTSLTTLTTDTTTTTTTTSSFSRSHSINCQQNLFIFIFSLLVSSLWKA